MAEFPTMHHTPNTGINARPDSYVVTAPYGTSERVAYGWTFPMSKRAATRLMKAVQPLYKGKLRAVMLKTALKG